MPLIIRPGMALPIPCRACAKPISGFTVQEGVHRLKCAHCAAEMAVEVYTDPTGIRIKTRIEKPARG
jgi:hypothetical protein